jgi:hypothetical protein
MNRLNLLGAIGGVLAIFLITESGSAAPLVNSAVIAKAAQEMNLTETTHGCHNSLCRRGPVEEWGGAVRWHRHAGPMCRPVRCSP